MGIYAVGLIGSKLIALGLQPLVAQWLGTEQFGRLDVLVTLSCLLTLLMTFGISDAIYRFAHDQPKQDSLIGNALALLVVIAGLLTLAGQLAVPWLQQTLPGEPPTFAIRCLLITLFLNTLCCVPFAILRLKNKAKQFVTAQLAFAITQGGGIVLLAPSHGVNGIIAAGLIAQAIQILILWRYFPRLQLGSTLLLLRYGRAITFAGVLSFVVLGAERWAIAHSLGLDLLAPYAVAIQWAIAASLLLEPFGLWWYPKRFALIDTAENRKQAATISVIGCQLSCLVTAGIITIGSRFLLWWLPEDFHPSAGLLPLLGVMVMVKHATTLLNIGCYHRKDGHSIMAIGIVSAITAAGILLFVLPQYGLYAFIGAGIGLQLLRLGLFYFWSQYYLKLPYPLSRLAVSYSLIILLLIAHYHASVIYELSCILLLITQVSWPWVTRKLSILRPKPLDSSLRSG